MYEFLRNELHLPLNSRTLSGSLSNSTLTVKVGAPTGLPIALPGGLTLPALGRTTLTVGRATGSLVITTANVGGRGMTAALKVFVAHAATGSASGRDVIVTLTLKHLPLLGTTLDFTGQFTRAPGGGLTGSLSTVFVRDAVASPGAFTVVKGSRVRLSTAGSLAVMGSALLGPTATEIPVDVTGVVTNVKNWRLSAASKRGARAIRPLPGLSISPGFSGTIWKASGVIRFDLAARDVFSYAPAANLTLHVASVELSTSPAGSGSGCSDTLADGHLWIRFSETAALSPAGLSPLNAVGRACADVGARTLVVSGVQTTPIILVTTPATVQLRHLTLDATVDLAARTVTGTGSGTSVVLAGGHQWTAAASFSLFPSGAAVVGFRTDLGALGLGDPGTTGQVYWASAAVPGYTDPVSGQQLNLVPGANGSASFTLSSGVHDFLVQALHLPLGASPTLTGDLAGGVLSVSVGAPSGLPVTLPAGLPALTFAPTTLAIDEGTGVLTFDAAATASDGITSSLHVEVDHASTSSGSGSDIHITLTIDGLPVLGTTVDLIGTLTRTSGALSGALTATLPADTTLRAGVLTLAAGSSVSLDTATGLTVSGKAFLGPADSALTVSVAGTFSDVHNWSLTVSTAGGAPTYSPLSNLTLSPAVTGTVTDASGAVTFDVSADDLVTWVPGSDVTVALTHFEVSNGTPGAGVTCPSTVAAGQVWVDVSGTVAYRDLSLAGEGCLDPQDKSFTVGTTASGDLLGSPDFTLNEAALQISGNLSTHKFAVSASAQLTLTKLNQSPVVVGVSFLSGSGFVAGAQLPDLSGLGIGQQGSGSIYVSNAAIKQFDPTVIPGMVGDPFNLKTGVNLTFADSLPDFVISNLAKLGIPITQVQAVATLGSAGFTLQLDLAFGAGKGGIAVYDANNFGLWINEVSIGLSLSASSQTVSLSGTALLDLPPATAGGSVSDISVTLTTTFTADTVNLSLGLVISGVCQDGVTSCPWTDAFGISGLSVQDVGMQLGLSFDTGVPVPSLKISADQVILPEAWASAIGEDSGTVISVDVNVTENDPLLEFSITGNPVALKPLSVIPNIDAATENTLVINDATLVVSPDGATTAAGDTVAPGITVVFDATFGGTAVHVLAAVDPVALSIDADVSVASFSVGKLSVQQPMFSLHIGTDGFHFTFSGGMSADTFTVNAAVSVQVGSSLVGAGVTITLVPGNSPTWLALNGVLQGTVFASKSSVDFTAIGTGNAVIDGQTLGAYNIWFDTTGLNWDKLSGDVATAITWFQNAGGQLNLALISALQAMQFTTDEIVAGVKQVYGSAYADIERTLVGLLFDAGVGLDGAYTSLKDVFQNGEQQTLDYLAAYLNSTGETASGIATAFSDNFGATIAQVASALNSFGADATAIGTALVNVMGATDAEAAAALTNLGYDAIEVTAALRALFPFETDVEIASVLNSAGVVEASVLAAVTESFHLSEQAVIADLGSLYNDISNWLNSLPGGFCAVFGC